MENPLVAFGKEITFEGAASRGLLWDFKVDPLTVMEYIGQVLAWMRLCMLEDPYDGFNGAEYYAHKILLFDVVTEDWAAEAIVGFKGQDLFDVLATRLDADPDTEAYRKAHETIWRLLTRSSMQKVTHGKNLTREVALGTLWDLAENERQDAEPRTFAELLRYGSVHFEQTREGIDYVKAEAPEMRIRKGLLEA